MSGAHAEPPAADRATARSLATEGFYALQEKRYADAADRFSRADALVHAPTLTLDWARSLVGLGQFVEAQERYELIIREGVDAKAPQSWQRALADAKAELAALKPRLAWAMITVTGSKDAQVTIDGVAVPAAAIGVRRAINPGAHQVRAVAPGYLASQKPLKLAEGEEGSVTIALQVDPNQQAAPEVEVTKPTPAVETPHHPNRTPAYVAFGVAGAGLLVGGITGSIWLGKRSTLEKQCPEPDQCPADSSDTVDAYNKLGYISGAGFIVGAAGIATGITLLLLDGKSTSTTTGGVVVRPYLGVGSVGAVGTF
ncbi:MAG TPA: hypothetical protein VGC79_22905 [Polyangiaceae bacterium]